MGPRKNPQPISITAQQVHEALQNLADRLEHPVDAESMYGLDEFGADAVCVAVHEAIAYVAGRQFDAGSVDVPIDLDTLTAIIRRATSGSRAGIAMILMLVDQLGPEVGSVLFRRELDLVTPGGALHPETVSDVVGFLLKQVAPGEASPEAWSAPFRMTGLGALLPVEDPGDDRIRADERRAFQQMLRCQPEPVDLMRVCWVAAKVVRRIDPAGFRGAGATDRKRAYELLVYLVQHAIPSATDVPDLRAWISQRYPARTGVAVDKATQRLFRAIRAMVEPFME